MSVIEVLPTMVVEMVNLQPPHQDHQIVTLPLQALLQLSTICFDAVLTRRHHRQLSHQGFQLPMVIPQYSLSKLDNKQKLQSNLWKNQFIKQKFSERLKLMLVLKLKLYVLHKSR
jgi:hypothetical protein